MFRVRSYEKMTPNTWLAWFIFENGLHPLFFHFIGLLRTGESNLAKLEMENGTELLLPEKTLAKMMVVDQPIFARPERSDLPTLYNRKTPGGEEVGVAVPVPESEKYTKVMRAAMGMYSQGGS